jgi:hypothetical protein
MSLSVDDLRPLSHWRRSGLICCRVAGLQAAVKPVRYLLLDYPSLARLAWSLRSHGFILLGRVKLTVDLTWKAISRCVLRSIRGELG